MMLSKADVHTRNHAYAFEVHATTERGRVKTTTPTPAAGNSKLPASSSGRGRLVVTYERLERRPFCRPVRWIQRQHPVTEWLNVTTLHRLYTEVAKTIGPAEMLLALNGRES